MSAVHEVLFGNLTRLRNVTRYSAEFVLQRENVAEHSFWTALIAVTIAHEYFRDEVDVGTVAVRALLHDIEESTTGDLVRAMKYHDQGLRDQIALVEAEFAASILKPMGETGEDYFDIWFNAKDDTLPGRIVALADLLCVISYCRLEFESGNHRLGQIERDCRQLIEDKFGHDSTMMQIVREAI